MGTLDSAASLIPLGGAAAAAIGATGASGTPGAAPDRAQVQALAQEFESTLLLQVMRQVRETITSWGDDGEESGDVLGGSLGPLTDTMDGEMARHLSQAGGFGLSSYLMGSLTDFQNRAAGLPAAPRVAAPAVPLANSSVVAPQVASAPVPATTPHAQVASPSSQGQAEETAGDTAPALAPRSKPVITSAFGWRSDPLQHTPRFHGGVDLRAAYGEPVPAAAEGRVVLAKDQGDYGLTVVIAHPGGFQTRYAHLSSLSVAPGDQVAENQTIGLAGRSGRATAPHVHFEVTREGHRLDPTSIVQARALKEPVARADYSSSGWSMQLAPAE